MDRSQNSHFNVHMFDLTAIEIDYPYRSQGNAILNAISQGLSYGNNKLIVLAKIRMS